MALRINRMRSAITGKVRYRRGNSRCRGRRKRIGAASDAEAPMSLPGDEIISKRRRPGDARDHDRRGVPTSCGDGWLQLDTPQRGTHGLTTANKEARCGAISRPRRSHLLHIRPGRGLRLRGAPQARNGNGPLRAVVGSGLVFQVLTLGQPPVVLGVALLAVVAMTTSGCLGRGNFPHPARSSASTHHAWAV